MLSFIDIFFLMGLGFSLAAPLGPVNLEMIKQSLQSKFGFLLGLITGIGAMSADFIIATVVLFIGDQFLRDLIEIPIVYIILLSFNTGLLLFIGVRSLRSEPIEENEEDKDIKYNSKITVNNNEVDNLHNTNLVEISLRLSARQYLTGFIIVVTSPWSYFWWTSFGGYILNSNIPLTTNLERFVVTVVFIGGIFLWVLLFCTLLGISRKFASASVLNYITKGSALIIIAFAFKILYDGIRYLYLI